MKKISSKHWYILTTVIIALGLLNSGCLQLEKVSFWKNNSKSKRIDILEEKVESLSYNMGSLTTENYELKKNFSELETVKNQLNEEYTQIKDKQIAIETAQTSQNKARSRLEGELAETRNLLEKVKQQLTLIEKDKNSLKAKLEKLESSREKAAETEAVVSKAPVAEEEKGNADKSREGLIREIQAKRKTSLAEDLLDKAIQLYREENFEEAIAKWEDVLALDPSKLEAKFNIEIAQDRIKEKQIQEDLKSSRTQRK
jgi:tetratricopeptide (TPR) repeat protein